MKYEGIPKLVQALQLMNSILVYVGDFFHPLNAKSNKILFHLIRLIYSFSWVFHRDLLQKQPFW